MRAWVTVLLAAMLLAGCQRGTPEPGGEPAGGGHEQQAAGPVKVVVYSPHGAEVLEPFEERFEAAHPQIDLEWLDLGSQAILDRLRAEKASPNADLWWGAPQDMFDKAAVEGLLQPYQPSWADHVAATRKHPDDLWYGQWLTPGVIMYNTEALKPEQAPQDWDELLAPQWKDKILIRDPLDSGTMRTFLAAMIIRQPTVEQGYAWLLKLDANTKGYPATPALLHRQLSAQEGVVSVWNLRDVVIQHRVNGYPLGYVLPRSGSPIVTDGIAVVKGARNVEAARTLYEWVTAEEQLIWAAEQFQCMPARDDIDPARLPQEMPKPASIKELPLDWGLIEGEGDNWVSHWDRKIRGQGGVR